MLDLLALLDRIRAGWFKHHLLCVASFGMVSRSTPWKKARSL